MKKFIENWKIKKMFFTKKDKLLTGTLLLLLIPGFFVSVFAIQSMKPNHYVVTLIEAYPDGTSFEEELTYKEKTQITLPELLKIETEDYELVGWQKNYKNSNKFTKTHVVNDDVTFYAKVAEVKYETIEEQTVVKYKVIEKEDNTLEVGVEKVETKGKDGYINSEFEYKYVDGKLVQKKGVKSDKTEAIDEVILVGTKEPEVKIQAFVSTPSESKPQSNTSSNTSKQQSTDSAKKPSTPTASTTKPKTESKPAETKPKTEPKPAETKPPVTNSYTPIYGVNLIPNSYNDNFPNCTAMQTVYPGGVPEGHPAYKLKHDRDKDGWACEVEGLSPEQFVGSGN